MRENVAILYLGPVAHFRAPHVRAPLDALIERLGVVLAGEAGCFQFLLVSLLAVIIHGLKVAFQASPPTTGTLFCPPSGVTRT